MPVTNDGFMPASRDFSLETERLLLRPYRPDDVEPLHAIQRDPVSWRFYPAPFTRERSEQWIADNVTRYEQHGFGMMTPAERV